MNLAWDSNTAFVAIIAGCIVALFLLRRLAGSAA